MKIKSKTNCAAFGFILTIFLSVGILAQTTEETGEVKIKKEEKKQEAMGPKKIETYEYFEAPDYQKITAEFFAKITEESNLLEGIYKKTPPGEGRAEILFRLADVYWLQAKYRNLREMELYQREYDRMMRGETKVKPKLPKLKGGRSLRIYDMLIRSYPQYSRIDEVLFLAGFHSSEIEYPGYYRYYEKLVKDFPSSRFIIDSKMSLGEYYFNNRKLNDAIETYKSVLAHGPSKVYYYALYKLGWCYYNQGDIRRAIDLLKTVVKKSSQMETKYAIELRDEALRNLVLFYSDIGKIDEAIAYFESLGKRDLSMKVLQNLAGTYFDQAKWKNTIRTYQRLIDFEPMGSEVPFYYSRVILSHQRTGDEETARKEMIDYVARFDKDTKWSKKNKKEDRESATERSEKYLSYIAKSIHEEAQKKKDKTKYVEATKYYKLYLEKFPAHQNAYEMKFLLAEIYYQLEDYASASKYYVEVISDKTNTQRQHEAAVSNIQALTFLEEKEFKEIMKERDEKRSLAKEGTPFDEHAKIAMGKWAPKLIEACDLFMRIFPNDPKISDTVFQKAKIQYNYNDFDLAMINLSEVINKYPKSNVSLNARRMILDIYGIRKDWDNIINWAAIFLKDSFFATPENKTYLLKLIQEASFKKGLELAKANQNEKAALLFVNLQKSYPDSQFADKALFNAIQNYMVINNFQQAQSLFWKLSKEYSSSDTVPKANLAIANNYESRLDYRMAAEYYEIFVEREPKSPKAPDCLYNAALYRETMEQYTKAIANYKKYITLYPNRSDIPDIYYNIGLVYEKARNWADATQAFRKYYNTYGSNLDKNIEARYRYAQGLEKINGQVPEREYRILIHYYNSQKAAFRKKSTGPSLAARWASRSELILLKPLYEKFEAIKFSMPTSALKRQIAQKANLLQQLQDRYLNIVKNYGDSETGIESLYQIGLIYQKFAEALFHAPVPKGLTPEALDIYQQELEKEAKPIEEKAVNAYEECLKKAYELNVYTEFTLLAYNKLQQYKPDKYKQVIGLPTYGTYRADELRRLTYERKVEIK